LLWKYYVISPVKKIGPIEIPWFVRREKAQPILPFADLLLSVFPVAWIFGRSGCASVHDHPGARAAADSMFAVAYPDRTPNFTGLVQLIHGNYPRYDLGLLELMFTVVLAGCIALTWHRRLPMGTYVVVACLSYAPVRFAMDYLRITDGEAADPRYGGLTPAQWCCFALFLYGLGVLRYSRSLVRRGIDPTDDVLAPPPPPPEATAEPNPPVVI
ncbi:MAG: prolipoprotein diacylglyceryl transferase family protein, partial [Polyangiaceae bacterium]